MHRRQFLTLIGGLAGAALFARSRFGAVPATYAQAIDRTIWWPPQGLAQGVAVEWRYLAGRYTRNGQDFGFVCSLVDYKEIRNPFTGQILQASRKELIVMREDFSGAAGHATRTYNGTLTYDAPTRTYSFTTPADPAVTATWTLDSTAPAYNIALTSPELTLDDLTLRPVGDLIPEGGDGNITSGMIGGITVLADYYADWLTIEQGGAPVGLARLDMQTIRPQGIPTPEIVNSFDHHWFALAGTLSDCTPVWISAWQIISDENTVWDVTIARGSGATWSVVSYTEESSAVAAPLDLDLLAWQPQPTDATTPETPARRTGKRWRLSAGLNTPTDLIDLTLEVPPGQFIKSARIASTREAPMQEAAGAVASGTIGGIALSGVAFLLAESTYAELDPDPTAAPTPDTPIISPPEDPTCTVDPMPTPTATVGPEPGPDEQIFLPLIRR